jgi:hypothetical protein
LALLAADKSCIVCAQESGGRPPRTGAEEGRRGDNGERGGRGDRRGGRRNGDRPDRPERGDSGDRERRESRADADPSPAPSAPTTAGFGATGGDADRAAGLRKWASDLIKKHDKNGNRMLETDEQEGLSSSSRGADLNGDGVITIDELVAHLSPKSSSPAATASTTSSTTTATTAAERSSPSSSSRGQTERAATEEASRTVKGSGKSYRFRSVKDRQTSWRFSGKDANGDGQVSMSEYSSTWNDRTAAEFRRYDRDNDGMITSEEVR